MSRELAAAAPFHWQVAVDYSTGDAQLLLSSQLEALCPATATSLLNTGTCTRHRDVEARQASANVLDLAEGPPRAADFMNMVIGGSRNPFTTRELGSAYAGRLQAEYRFDGRFKRGWWISAAMDCQCGVSGAGKRMLSQRIAVLSAVKIMIGRGI